PCCSYGASKAFVEALARAYEYRTDMSLIGLRLGLCAPEATPEQAAAGWLQPADLQRIVTGALETEVRSGVYNAVSWAARRRWGIDTTMADLGYDPARDAEDPPHAPDDFLITCDRSA
ncbi:hypothetical protein AB0M20_41940, partial [Actinoplanes sp. NPDC051633]